MQPCPTCPRDEYSHLKFSPIRGSGPLPCPYLLIGERPGETEEAEKEVFIGRSGEELDDTYLPLSGLSRSEVRVTNSCKCYAENNKTPTEKELWGCAKHWLPGEIQKCQPELIVLLGASACKLTESSNLSINLETHHGRPHKVRNFMGVYNGWIWTTYHPALGMHKTDAMTPLLEDFDHMGQWLRKRWSPPIYHTVPPTYSLVRHAGEMQPLVGARKIAIDTEDHGGDPFSIQWCSTPGTARMALFTPQYEWAFKELGHIIRTNKRAVIIFHNAPGDQDILEKKTGVRQGTYEFRDTMQEAFHQGNQPQKLKALAYRLLGVTMRTWEDVVKPDSINKTIEWMGEALQIAHDDLAGLEVKVMKTLLCKRCGHKAHKKVCKHCECEPGGDTIPWVKETRKSSPIETRLTGMIRASNNPEYKLWDKAGELWTKNDGMFDDARAYIEQRIGRMPILGIGNCKITDAVQYACGDADMTLQSADKLEEGRQDPKWRINDDDRDT